VSSVAFSAQAVLSRANFGTVDHGSKAVKAIKISDAARTIADPRACASVSRVYDTHFRNQSCCNPAATDSVLGRSRPFEGEYPI
jgi:hypothetical protein